MDNRSNDCAGVCAEIRERLVKMGLIGPQVQRHGPIYEALDKVVFVSKEDLDKIAEDWVKKYQ